MKYLYILCISLIFFSCGNDAPPKEDCRYGSPTPMFGDTYEKVTRHNFEQKGQKAFEEVDFENGMKVAIQQAGCNDIQQVFQLNIPGDLSQEDPTYFKKLVIGLFRYFGTVSEKHFTFNQFANLITEQMDEIHLGEKYAIAPNFYVKIDKVLGAKNGLLLVELSSKGAEKSPSK